MDSHPIAEFTDELLRIAGRLDRGQAVAFVRRVYEAGRQAARRESAEAEKGREHAGW